MRVILENIHEYNHCVLLHFNKIEILLRSNTEFSDTRAHSAHIPLTRDILIDRSPKMTLNLISVITAFRFRK